MKRWIHAKTYYTATGDSDHGDIIKDDDNETVSWFAGLHNGRFLNLSEVEEFVEKLKSGIMTEDQVKRKAEEKLREYEAKLEDFKNYVKPEERQKIAKVSDNGHVYFSNKEVAESFVRYFNGSHTEGVNLKVMKSSSGPDGFQYVVG